MEMLKNWRLGSGQPAATPTGAETVERICARARTSTLLTDKRDALRGLKALSKTFRQEVGTQAMDIFITTLVQDKDDPELASLALETLSNLTTQDPLNDTESQSDSAEAMGLQFTDIFLSDAETNIAALLALIDEFEFKVRFAAVKLLTGLLHNRSKMVQDTVLVSPMGVSKLMDLLSDSREVVRNDALLLLIELTRGHTSIQKIVAFENAYELLFGIITAEGLSDGGIVVEDCLNLLYNLLHNNKSNQTLFTEGNLVRRLTMFFEFDASAKSESANKESATSAASGWPAQKVANTNWMLRIVRTLVAPTGSQRELAACQRLMASSGLLSLLCSVLMAHGVPADVLSTNIGAVAEIIRGNAENQAFFATVMAPSVPPSTAIVVLLMSMVNEGQPFALRCAVLYCFQCFLYKNDLGQSQIISTFLPSSAPPEAAQPPQVTAGALLCSGLFSADAMSSWFAAVALVHIVLGKVENKETLLRVQLRVTLDQPELLFQQCMNILSQPTCKTQTKIGLLMLLGTWMCRCPAAVTQFLSREHNSLFLVSQVGSHESDPLERTVQGLCAFLLGVCLIHNNGEIPAFDQASLRGIIEKRIGAETFCTRLSHIPQSESYAMAAKTPYITASQADEVLFDYEFTKLFKSYEMEIIKKLEEKEGEQDASVHNHDSIVTQYKEIIRGQDEELRGLKAKYTALEESNRQLQTQSTTQLDQIQTLRDQNALYKTGGKASPLPSAEPITNAEPATVLSNGVEEMQAKDQEIASLRQEAAEYKAKLEQLQASQQNVDNQTRSADTSAADQQHRDEIEALQQKLEATLGERSTVIQQGEIISQLEQREAELKDEIDDLKQKLKEAKNSQDEVSGSTRAALLAAEAELATAVKDLAEKTSENEDLLVLMEDQSEKIDKYRKMLIGHGEVLSEEDDDEDDDDDDDVNVN